MFAVLLAMVLADLNNRFAEALTLREGGLALAGPRRSTCRRIPEGRAALSRNGFGQTKTAPCRELKALYWVVGSPWRVAPS